MARRRADSSVITAAATGDRRSLDRLLAQEQPRLYAYSKGMCGNAADAEDVMQEAMLAVARNIGEFRGTASFSTWLFQIARSFCIKKRRLRKGQPATFASIDGVAVAGDAAGPESAAGRKETARAIDEALRSLSPEAREVVVLRDVEGLSAAEAAEVLGLSVAALKSKLHRARAELAHRLAPVLGRKAEARRRRACPDILRLYSQQLEGELSASLCKRLERHVASCGDCRDSCKALKSTLAMCGRTRVVPKEVQERVRVAVRLVLDGAGQEGTARRRGVSSSRQPRPEAVEKRRRLGVP
jgi:RNA polymerase sigma-70 factor, ECF subfamily